MSILKRITIRKLQGDRGDVVPFPETFAALLQVAADVCGYTSDRIPHLHISINGGEITSRNYHLIRDRDIVEVEFEHPKWIQQPSSESTAPKRHSAVNSSIANGITVAPTKKRARSTSKKDPDEDDQHYVEGKRASITSRGRRAANRVKDVTAAVAAAQEYVEVDEDETPLVEEKKKTYKRVKRATSPSASTVTVPTGPPVKSHSAYWFFSQHYAKEIAQSGDLSTISQQAGSMWKELPPSEKNHFLQLAIEDKNRYETELAAWEAAQRKAGLSTSTSASTSTTPATTTTTTTTAEAPPQPPQEEVKKICTSVGCDKVALLGPCPNCVELGLPAAYFCSQTCFETGWQQHAQKHTQAAVLAQQHATQQQLQAVQQQQPAQSQLVQEQSQQMNGAPTTETTTGTTAASTTI